MGRTREKGRRGLGSGSRGSLCLAHPTVLPSSCLVPLPPLTGRCPVGEAVATPAERKEGWAEREGRLRRGVDLAEGWAGGTQGSWAPRPQCSGVDPGLLPLRACPQPLGAEDGVLRSQRGAWLDPRLLYRVSSQILGRDLMVGGGAPGSQPMLQTFPASPPPHPPNVLSTARSSAGQAAAASQPCRTEIPE